MKKLNSINVFYRYLSAFTLKYHLHKMIVTGFALIVFCENVLAQTVVPCSSRLIENVGFTYNGGGVEPARWDITKTDPGGFILDQTAYAYVPTGNFSNQNINWQTPNANLNATRQYAIVRNPKDLSPQYADIPTDGMIVLNPKQGEDDQYGQFQIANLQPLQTYYVEIKFYNVLSMTSRGPSNQCYSWCNWNNELNILWEGNGNNAHDGQAAMTWTGSNGSGNNNGNWDGWGNQISNWMWASPTGSYAIMKGQMTLGNATSGFTFTFRKKDGSNTNPIVLGIEYIKIYGCQAEAINVSGGSNSVCEGTDLTLTAQGLGSKGSTYAWYKDGVLLPGRTTDTLMVVSPIGTGSTATYKAVGEWSNQSVTLTSKMCCSSVGGTSDEVIRQSFNNLTYTCTTRAGGYADIPDKGVKNFIDPAYVYAGTSCNSLNDGQYAVVQSSFAGDYWKNRPEVKDHTGIAGSGSLFINAVGGVGQVFYKFNLDGLCNGTRYEFSAWYASLATGSETKPNIEFDVMNGATKVESVTTGIIPENSKWYQATVTFVTPTSGNPTYTLQLANLVSASSGNDLMLDDIVVKKCTPFINLYQDGTKNMELDVCNDLPVKLTINTYYDLPLAITGSSSGTVYYQWMESTSPNGPWTLIGTPVTTGSISVIPLTTTKYYRAKVSADFTRASTGLSPLASECGNDGMTTSFKLVKGGNFTIPAATGTTTYCEDPANTISLTGDAGTGTEWGWKKGTSYAVATFITGYSFSSDVTKKIFTKTGITTADAGNYYFVVKNASGCEAYSTLSVTVNAKVTPTFTAIAAICEGATAPVLPTTSSNGITGTWSPATVNTVTPGTTTYTFTPAANQCANGTSIQITVTAKTVPAFNAIAAVCVGAAAPTLPATSTNGISGTWSPATVNTATAGTTTYNFTPSANQCASTTSLQVTVSSPSTIPTFAAIAALCIGSIPPTLPATSTNGISGTWSPATINTATAGTTTYNFTPGTGQCATTTSLQVTINAATVPTFNSIPSVCVGSTPPALPTTSTNGITGTWSPATISTASVGTTTYTFTPSANQCATTATLQVTVSTAASAGTLSGTQNICLGNSTTFSSTQPGGTWSSADPLKATINSTSGVVNSLLGGTVTMTYTVLGTNGCTDASATRTVTITAPPVAGTLSGTQNVCSGNTTNFSSTQAGGVWSSANTSIATVNNTSGVVSGVAAGSATITYTVAGVGGCVDATATRTVIVSAPPIAGTLSGNQSICIGNTTTFSSTQSGGTWSSSDAVVASVNSNSGVITGVAGGTATITYTVAGVGGCTDATATRTVTVSTPPVAGTLSGNQAICIGSTTTFNSTQSGGIWSTSDAIKASVNNTTGVVTGLAGGSATITYTVAGSGGCVDATAIRTVTVTAPPIAGTISGTQDICVGTTTVFSSSQTGGLWSTSNSSIASVNTSGLINGVSEGVASIIYTMTGSGGCTDVTATRNVTIAPIPAAPTGTSNSRCGAGVVGLAATPSGGATNTIDWYSNSSLTSQVATGNSFVTPSLTTTTNYYITETNPVGCRSKTASIVTATISQTPMAPVAPATVNYCLGDMAAPLAASGANLTWYTPSGNTNIPPVPSTAVGGVTQYFVSASDGTCESPRTAIKVNVNEVTAYAGGPVVRVDEGKPYQLNGKATGNNISITWTPNIFLNSNNVPNPIITTTQDNTYTMRVVSTDGCSASDNVKVIVLRALGIPNAFSPNGDGVNDTWVIQNISDYVTSVVSIYNRYGQLIYEASAGEYAVKPWNGTYNGNSVPVGTYYYIIKLSGGKPPVSGSIAVVR